MNLVLDIETSGYEFESLSESQREYLLRYAEKENDENKRDEAVEDAKRYLSLYPYTAKVIAIGLLNTQTEKELVLFEGEESEELIIEEKNIKYKPADEKKMLTDFWHYAAKAKKVISFNGRNFDIPFLMLRSAMLKIKPTVNFIKNRYDYSSHIDLLEQLTFFGLTKKFNLDFYCRSFGIESPKSKGISGMEVKELYNAGKIKEIAVYCGQDVKATFELYKIWDEFLNI